MVLLALIVLLVLSVPAGAAVPNTIGWHVLSNTQINSNGCQWTSGPNAGGTGCAAITGAWNGALFDTTRNQLILMNNGGHNDYYGNEVIRLTIGSNSAITDTQVMSRMKDSSASPQSYGDACRLSDGSPRSFHTYTNVEYVPDQDRYYGLGGATSPLGNMTNCVYYLNPTTLTWTFLSSSPIDRSGGFWGSGAAWDGERHVLWASDQDQVFYLTTATGVWTTPSQTLHSGTGSQGDMSGVVDPVTDRYYLIGNGAIWYWSIANPSSPRTPPSSVGARQNPSTSGCGTAFNGAPGVAFDPVQNRIAIWNGGNTIYLLNTSTHVCTTTVLSGGPSAVSNGTYGRFRYSPKDNLFVTCQATSANCYALRLTLQNADSDFGRRCRAPGVTLCEGFDTLSDYTNGVKYFNGDGGFDGADMDTTIKTSGAGSLRFNLPAGRGTSNISGDWRNCIRTPCTINGNDTTAPGFGFPSDFWMSWRIRITPTMVSNLLNHWRAGGSRTGWKSVNLHNGAQGSCGALEITKTIDTNFPAGTTQIWYKQCSPGITTDANGNGNGGAPYMQQGNNTQSTATNGFWCNWNQNTNFGTGTGQGCFGWQWQNEWITFIEHYQIGANGTASSQLDAWIYREGSTTALQIQNVNNESFGYGSNPVGQRTYNQVSFTPYMTGLNTSAPVDANMWIDEFIVSTEEISAPLMFGSAPDTTPPAAPTGVTIQ